MDSLSVSNSHEERDRQVWIPEWEDFDTEGNVLVVCSGGENKNRMSRESIYI